LLKILGELGNLRFIPRAGRAGCSLKKLEERRKKKKTSREEEK